MSGVLTEAEWLTGADPGPMLAFLDGKASDRKLRLFNCACCRRIWHLIPHAAYRKLVELAEGFADGHVSWQQLRDAEHAAYEEAGIQGRNSALWAATHTTGDMRAIPYDGEDVSWVHAASAAAKASAGVDFITDSGTDEDSSWWHATIELAAWTSGPLAEARLAEQRAQACLVRDLFGNPFRPVAIDPVWRSANDGCTTKLARAIYQERRFADLPVLADALEEAGCANADILAHCRRPGEHARGCWVVDALLDKA
jgi:hypothetical protein